MKGFEDQIPLAPLTQVLQQRAGQQAGQGLGLGHLPETPHCLTASFRTAYRTDVGDKRNLDVHATQITFEIVFFGKWKQFVSTGG